MQTIRMAQVLLHSGFADTRFEVPLAIRADTFLVSAAQEDALQKIWFADPEVEQEFIAALRACRSLPLLLDIFRCEASASRAEQPAGGVLADCHLRLEHAES